MWRADMAGNIWEWRSTRWGTERSQPQYAPPYDPGDGRESLTRDETLPRVSHRPRRLVPGWRRSRDLHSSGTRSGG